MTSKEKAIQIVKALVNTETDDSICGEVSWLVTKCAESVLANDSEVRDAVIALAATGALNREYGVAVCER